MLVNKLSLFLSYCRSECSFSKHTCLAYETDLNQSISEEHTEKLFDQDPNEEEDFEIPAFLRKQKF